LRKENKIVITCSDSHHVKDGKLACKMQQSLMMLVGCAWKHSRHSN